MNQSSKTHYNSSDYEAIETAIASSDRGRWFLEEFARKNRVSDTQTVMTAIEKLQNVVSSTLISNFPIQDDSQIIVDTIRNDLMEMARQIVETHHDIAAIGLQDQDPKHASVVSGELDAIVHSIELATSEILESAEEIQEIAWTMREGGLAVETCDAIDSRSTKIYLACSFQDLTAQRTTKVINTMRFLENRINKMIGILQGVEGFGIVNAYGHANLVSNKSEHQEQSLEQHNIDFVLGWNGKTVEGIESLTDNWVSKNIPKQVFLSESPDPTPELSNKSADVVPLHNSEQTQVSKLNELNGKSLEQKILLFT